ncbi:MAG TPA: hypothetical protein VFP34_05450 [Microlunatus sp.]|nr:hypothetical protein [Microlunatus sp.]
MAQKQAQKQPQDLYAQRLKQLTSTVQRIRGWVGSDPSRSAELGDALVELTAHRLLGHAYGDAAPDAQESVVLSGKLVSAHGPIGPYTPVADAVRYFTAAVHLAAIQAGVGLHDAAGQTMRSTIEWQEQLRRHLTITEQLLPGTAAWALMAQARGALEAGDIEAANAAADAALDRSVEGGLTELPDAYVAMDVHRVVADVRWASGRIADALAHDELAREQYERVVDGRLATPARLSPALLARLSEPLFPLTRVVADRLIGGGEYDRGLFVRRGLIQTLRGLTKRLGQSGTAQLARSLDDLAADLRLAGRENEAVLAEDEAASVASTLTDELGETVRGELGASGGRPDRRPGRHEPLESWPRLDPERALAASTAGAAAGSTAAAEAELLRLAEERAAAERLEAQGLEEERQARARHELVRREAERAEADRREAERAEAARREQERLSAERAAAERAEAERRAAEEEAARRETKRRREERLEAHRLEEERLAAERAAAERAEAERLEAEAAAAEAAARAEAEAERLDLERLAAELAELERAEAEAAQEAERRRVAAEQAEQAERERLQRERLEHEEAERFEADRLAAEQAERERLERETAERAAVERAEAERRAWEEAERAEREREAAEQAELERVERERREREEAERVAAEQAEAERLAAEQAERERLERDEAERAAAERAEAERAAEQAERERVEREAAEREAAELAERAEAEQAERERVEQERQVAEWLEGERRAREEAERAEREREEAERWAAEQAERERLEREAAEHAAAESAEAERLAEQAERERVERERIEREAAQLAEADRARAERLAAEQAAADTGHVREQPEPQPTEPSPAVPQIPDELDLAIREWQQAKAAGERRRSRAANELVVELLRPRAAAEPRAYGPQLIDALEQLSSIRLRTGDIFGARAPSREAKALAKSLGL